MTDKPPIKVNVRSLVKKSIAAAGLRTRKALPDPDLPPIEWLEKHFFVPERNGPIVFEPYHRRLLQEAYRQDENGLYVYSTIIWSDIKKSIKSTIAAAIALERARSTKWGSIKIVANDLKQAQSRVSFYLQRAIQMNPELSEVIVSKSSRTELPNHTVIEAIPIDPHGEAGGNDDLIIFSELWGADSDAAKLMWAEMTLSPTKYGRSQRWVETYAGFTGESETLEQQYQLGVVEGRRLDIGILYPNGSPFEVYVNDSARMLCVWNGTPMCSWQNDNYYAQEEAALTPIQFARVHRNQWASSLAKFVPDEWWLSCKVASLPALDKYAEIAVGIDAGVTSDCFGIVAVSRHGEKMAVRVVRKWTPPVGGKLEFSNVDDPDDTDYPEGVLRQLAKDYNVIAFGYDPSQLHHLCTSLSNDGVGFFQSIDQGKPRLTADKQLYDIIKERRLIHDGNVELTEHVQNANAKNDPNEHSLRIVKRTASKKIDLCVSLSMACYLGYKLLSE